MRLIEKLALSWMALMMGCYVVYFGVKAPPPFSILLFGIFPFIPFLLWRIWSDK